MTDRLHQVTDRVVERARAQGFTLPGEVQEELTAAGLEPDLWKDVLALARSSLLYEGGKYWYRARLGERAARQKTRLDVVVEAVRPIIQQHRQLSAERRGEERIDFIHPVVLIGEDDQEHHVLTRDLSVTGVRLIGTRQLLGQKVRLRLDRPGSDTPWTFRVQILWTCAVGDDLFENGGVFLDVEA